MSMFPAADLPRTVSVPKKLIRFAIIHLEEVYLARTQMNLWWISFLLGWIKFPPRRDDVRLQGYLVS